MFSRKQFEKAWGENAVLSDTNICFEIFPNFVTEEDGTTGGLVQRFDALYQAFLDFENTEYLPKFVMSDTIVSLFEVNAVVKMVNLMPFG